MGNLKLGNIVMFKGLTFTVTGISSKFYTLTPIYSERGTLKVETTNRQRIDKLADSPQQWAIGILAKET